MVLFLGQMIHETISEHLSLEEIQSLGCLHDMFREIWRKNKRKMSWDGEYNFEKEEEIDAGKKGLRMLEHFYNSQFNCKPKSNEQSVTKEIMGDIPFIGRVDRVENFKNGTRIVDYKTGKLNTRFLDTFQLEVYAWLSYRDEEPVVSAGYYFLEADRFLDIEFDSKQYTKTQLTIEKKTALLMQSMKKGDLKPKQSNLCPWCEYKSMCPTQNKGSVETKSEQLRLIV